MGRLATTTIRGDGVASVLPYASSTALPVSGHFYGANLTNCNTSSDKLLWADGEFDCGTDQTSGGSGTDVNWTFFNGSGLRPATPTNQGLGGGTSTSTLLSPLAKLGVLGGASIDYASTTGISASYASSTALYSDILTVLRNGTIPYASTTMVTATTASTTNLNISALGGSAGDWL